jgi:hypothetical protein
MAGSRKYENGIPSAFRGQAENRAVFPFLFQVLSPDRTTLLLPEAFYLHINPTSLTPTFAEDIQRIQTGGGWVEQHWGQVLTDLAATASSGAFMNVYTGLTSGPSRRETIAYEKVAQLKELYHNNGSVYNTRGDVVLQGLIRLTYSGGIYDGHFTSLTIREDAESPFSFSVDWAFKVESEAYDLVF